MPRALKVFATSVGFFQAVVAVPSQKAALTAWGVRDDLFASGAAHIVDDPELIRQALARPGEIIRVAVAADAEFVAAAKPVDRKPSMASSPPERSPPKPAVDRGPLERAQQAFDTAQARKTEHADAIEAERAALEARAVLEAKRDEAALARAQQALDSARRAYEAAVAR